MKNLTLLDLENINNAIESVGIGDLLREAGLSTYQIAVSMSALSMLLIKGKILLRREIRS